MSNLFTGPEHRRRGIAHLLLRHIATAAAARGGSDHAFETRPVT